MASITSSAILFNCNQFVNPQQKNNRRQVVDALCFNLSPRPACIPLQARSRGQEFCKGSESHRYVPRLHAVSAEREDVGVSTQSEEVTIAITGSSKDELKVSVKVSGSKTEAIFNDVFTKMVAAAQPIPGFRRVKGGKTPNIRQDILLEVLGPSKVYKQVIKKLINVTIAEYVKKEGIKAGVGLTVGQSFEELELAFEPGEDFQYDATIPLL